jgi:hypothetical protein
MSGWKFEILADVRVQTHYITIMDCLSVRIYLMVETHGLGSIPVQGIACGQGTVPHDGMCQQFGLLFDDFCGILFTFPDQYDCVPDPCYLFETRHGAFIAFSQCIPTHGFEVA